MKPCTVPGCGRVEYLAHGYCDMHYKRWRKSGDTSQGRKSAAERFWAKVTKTPTCWLWSAALDPAGYGAFNVSGRIVKAHRVAYELTVGEIPHGLTLDHLCRIRSCVRPEHLEPVPGEENARRATQAGYFGNPYTCHRGHDWTADPPYIADRGNGKTQRMCRVCARERRRKVLAQ